MQEELEEREGELQEYAGGCCGCERLARIGRLPRTEEGTETDDGRLDHPVSR